MPRPLFPSAKRRGIASSDPVALEMWRRGARLQDIVVVLGYSPLSSPNTVLGVPDPLVDPVPPRVPVSEWRAGESDEARVWRRFPITAHKPGRA